MVDIGEPKKEIIIEPFPETAPQEEPRPSTPAPAPVAPSAPSSPERQPEEVPA